MPNCSLCNDDFPNKVFINGKERILSSRKFCLQCSPFGKHNTSKNPINRRDRKTKRIFICKKCNKERNESGTNLECIVCRSSKRRRKQKEKAVYLFGGKCSKCGYSKSINALEFHHKVKEEKSFNLSMNWHRSWDILKVELDKCELICSNCHKELHGDVT